MNQPNLLDIRDLHIHFPVNVGSAHIVKGVDLTLARGEILGLIGESGSGKTVTGLSLLGLLPQDAQINAQKMEFNEQSLLALSPSMFESLRGVRLAMIFQDPVASFNPVKRLGWHFRTIFQRISRQNNPTRQEDWRVRTLRILQDVGIARATEIIDVYPHQLSGGMLQRALIGLVLAMEPDLIVADEPTTNLDKIVEGQILQLFKDLRKRLSAALIFITHDMSVASSLCDRIAVMYAGQIVESGPTSSIFSHPKHPYTQGLIGTALALSRGSGERLQEIPGAPPNPTKSQSGCLFQPRCAQAMPKCQHQAPLSTPIHRQQVSCLLYPAGAEQHA